ncbi:MULTISPECIES: hypothetical protein [Pseudoalteromonas]|uniref:Uncharacterized protein n=1 Tax=Pseudoalteromonas peptidolytica F12-50-A1 TaxID=1315280 RepID=A0A8I0T1X0_9GAMM|nr:MULTISPECIES: hypothetical protein [Pseudoalteromonas]MBE0344941.1 hypothetical protein [Pseudoalteromonas peptidolytica F12-50-A1]MDW7550448.1 hypothetical protein [Pseudoalteromonas peptidolytica]GEK08337.1 hypothetical protein PPE03_05860 [Pseudoalteromonas peptidolytica]
MSIQKLKKLSKLKQVQVSKDALSIMRTQGCSSCCSFSGGGNSQEMK